MLPQPRKHVRSKEKSSQSPSGSGSWLLLASLPSLAIKRESKFTYCDLLKQAASQAISLLISNPSSHSYSGAFPEAFRTFEHTQKAFLWNDLSRSRLKAFLVHLHFTGPAFELPLPTIFLWLSFRWQGVCVPTSGPTVFSSANPPDAFWNSIALNIG